MLAITGLASCAFKKQASSNPYTSDTLVPPKPSILQMVLAKIPNPFPKKQKSPAAVAPQWTGVIRMVNSAESFVLVESSAIPLVIPGETYLAVNNGLETATLKMTSLKNPPFLIADIVSGTPSPGDKIYLPKAPTASPSPTPKPTPKSSPSPKPTSKAKAQAPSPSPQ